ncbi:ThiF family adenylyltransferase [Helicobacter marmotae]|uniref:tRNA cyclic N6-threonylcarbamoyladenosine(37) synthase TcdA n=1 Tax=Helicobacter marmotae TaxID=152490 RepID=A0A3D8I150_9HELI|nr:ThiF family adenylyltransferase [Helicobacter marmotae]RDU58863.1 tRNA cyclic N6-threonylcarbamoyladenosine(37) synthase TcdA [Helicobacter marmotae]
MNEIIDRYTRSRLLFGDTFTHIQNTKVILFGVGGVGGFALDCLYRSGVKHITIVDKDYFDVTNQNRQIGAEHINEAKVRVLAQMYPGIIPMQEAVNAEFLKTFDIMKFDYIIDAIDDIYAKVEIAKIAQDKPMGHYIVSTGSAKKLSPLHIQVDSIWKTHGDKFARKLRDHLKKAGIKKAFKAVFSPEKPKCKPLGSFSAVTASFGLTIASEVIQHILKENDYAKQL